MFKLEFRESMHANDDEGQLKLCPDDAIFRSINNVAHAAFLEY